MEKYLRSTGILKINFIRLSVSTIHKKMCVKKAMRHYNLKKEKTLVTFSNTGFHWKGTKFKDMDVLAICVAIVPKQI